MKKTNLHIAGAVGTRAAADQMEGGEQVQQSARCRNNESMSVLASIISIGVRNDGMCQW